MSADARSRPRHIVGQVVSGVALVAAGLGTAAAVLLRRSHRDLGTAGRAGRAAGQLQGPWPASGLLEDLPEATSSAVLDGAPMDSGPHRGTAGLVVHPRAPQHVFDRPAGTAFALIRPVQPWGQTWLPVIDERPGWVRVLLPSRRPSETGWLDAARVSSAHSRHEIRVNLSAGRLRLWHDGRAVGTWPISLRSPESTVPSGRTFVLAAVRRTPQSVPLLLRLALHAGDSDPGLVTIHRQPAPGHTERASHGCIRVPDAAMTALGAVPPGCLVRLYDRPTRFRKALPL